MEKKPTETQIAIDAAIAKLTAMRNCYAAKADIDYDAADDLRALRDLALDVAGAVDPIFRTIAEAGNSESATCPYKTIVFDAIHDDLAAELSVAASEAADRLNEGAKYERDDFAEHNTLFAAAQL